MKMLASITAIEAEVRTLSAVIDAMGDGQPAPTASER
jgi:hypothetical protein